MNYCNLHISNIVFKGMSKVYSFENITNFRKKKMERTTLKGKSES